MLQINLNFGFNLYNNSNESNCFLFAELFELFFQLVNNY